MSSSSPGFDCRRGGGDDSDTTSSSSISSDDDEDDDFDMFAKYKGTGMLMPVKRTSKQRPMSAAAVMCLHYFSDALQFGFSANEEVYRLDQIKEWAPPESKVVGG